MSSACPWNNSTNSRTAWKVATWFLRFQIFTAVVVKSSIFCDIIPCSPLIVNRRFGGTSPSAESKNKPSKNQHEVRWQRALRTKSAIAQTVTCRLSPSASWVQSQVRTCAIYGRQWHWGEIFRQVSFHRLLHNHWPFCSQGYTGCPSRRSIFWKFIASAILSKKCIGVKLGPSLWMRHTEWRCLRTGCWCMREDEDVRNRRLKKTA
jgi:hypothetical protein